MSTQLLVENLGLTAKEAAVYLAILELGKSTIKPIAAQAGIKRTSIYYFINHLVELGLIDKMTIRNHTHYTARPPEELVNLQQRRLARLQQALPQFASLYNSSTQKPKISYFEGPEQMKQVLFEETRCHQELWGIWSGQEVAELFGPELLRQVEDERRAKGVHIQVVRVREKDEPFEQFKEYEGANRELRYAPAGTVFPLAFSIYDTGKVGIMSSKKEGFGILIESAELVAAMKTLFNCFWNQAKPS